MSFLRAAVAGLLILLVCAAGASAATLSVTSHADSGPGSLRAVVGASAPGDTVKVPGGQYLVGSEIPITVPLIIQGAGSAATILDGGTHTRIFHVTSAVPPAATLSIQGLTLTRGRTTSAPGGGAILQDAGNLALTDDVLSNNVAMVSVGNVKAAGGGAIYNGGGSTTLTRASLTGNSAAVTVTAPGTGTTNSNCCHGGGALFSLNGAITITGSTLNGNSASLTGPDTGTSTDPCCGGGGAVYQQGTGSTTLTGSTLDGNTVAVTSGECCHGGGAIEIDKSSSATGSQPPNLSITSSHLDHNSVSVQANPASTTVNAPCCSGGGAVTTYDGVIATSSTFDFNTVSLTNQNCCNGGGAFNFDSNSQQSTFSLDDLSGNQVNIKQTSLIPGKATGTCCNGGGALQLDVNNPVLSVTSSLLSNNKANFSGPVVESGGGAVYEDTSTSYKGNYLNSTIAGNSTNVAAGANSNSASNPNPAGQGAGGIFEFGASGTQDTLVQSTLAGNSASAGNGGGILVLAGDLRATNSIIARNPSAAGGGSCAAFGTRGGAAGTLSSGGHNIEDRDTCNLHAPGDRVSTDPKLGPLQFNGGPLNTMALLDGSPAINAADHVFCPASDMRGVPRPQPAGGACDIGAYEATGPAARTTVATGVTDRSATLNAQVNPANLTTTVHFEYGRTAGYGRSTPSQVVPGGTYGERGLRRALSGLTRQTTYHYRVVATNLLGTVTGGDSTFRTGRPGRLVVFTGRGFVSPSGVATLFAACLGNSCNGRLQLSLRRAGQVVRRLRLGGDQGAVVTLRLTRGMRRALARDRRHHLRVRLNLSDTSPHRRTQSLVLIGYSNRPVAGRARVGPGQYGGLGFVDSRGRASVFVGCFGPHRCSGTITLSGARNRVSFRLRAESGTLVTLTLTRRAWDQLRRRGHLGAALSLRDDATRHLQRRRLTLVTYR